MARWSLGAAVVAAFVVSSIGCRDSAEEPPKQAAETPVDSLLSQADAVYWSGESDSAKVLFTRALAEARGAGDPAAEARATTGLGRVAYRQDDYRLARRLGESALSLKLKLGLQNQLFDSYNLLGLVAGREGRHFDAITSYGPARELAEAAADTANLAKVWTNLALSHIELGEFPDARRLLSNALPAARASGQGLIEGRVLTNLGMLAVRTGAPDSAVQLLQRGLAILRAAEDRFGEQNNLGQLGTAYAALGEPGRAIAYLDSAAAQARATESPQEEASDLEQLAQLHRDAGEFPRALQLLERARLIHAELGLADETGADLRNVAEIYLILGNVAPARRAADSALRLHRAAGARLSELSDHLVLALIDHQAADRAGADRELDAARQLAETMDAPLLRARVAMAAARIADRGTDPAAVLRILGSARADLPFGGQDREWEVHWLIARARARLGELDSAAAGGRRAVEAVERVRGDFASASLRTSYQAERASAYGELVDVLLRLGRRDEALEIADGARGRALLDHLASIHSNGGPTARELAEGERQRLSQIEQVMRRIESLESGNDRDLVARYQTDIDRLYRELEGIRSEFSAALIRSEEQEPRRRALLGGRPESARVRAALRSDEALLEYLIGPERLTVFVVTRDTVETFATEIIVGQLDARIRVTRELLSRRGDPLAAVPALEALEEILIGPARASRAMAQKRSLIIVPHGPLSYLPFAALRDRKTGRYLVEDYAVMHLPSAGSLPALRGGRFRATGTAEAPVAFAPFASALPGTAAEARAVAAGVANAVAVSGRQATEARVRLALVSAPIVHLATHGVLNAQSPLFSRIELVPGHDRDPGDDGRLEVHEVDRASIGAGLVFLSGCETGLGVVGSTSFAGGEDYATLARAFLHAGAGNVIATLWRIEDAGAAAFATTFYRELARGPTGVHGDLTDALALAQREMLRQPEYRSPYYWAGYQLSGSGDLAVGNQAAQDGRAVSVLGGKPAMRR